MPPTWTDWASANRKDPDDKEAFTRWMSRNEYEPPEPHPRFRVEGTDLVVEACPLGRFDIYRGGERIAWDLTRKGLAIEIGLLQAMPRSLFDP